MCCCLRSVKQFQDEHTWPHCIKVKYVSGIFVAIICLSLHRDQGYCKYNYIFRTSFMFSFLCCIWFHQINSLIKILFLFLQSKNLIGTLTASEYYCLNNCKYADTNLLYFNNFFKHMQLHDKYDLSGADILPCSRLKLPCHHILEVKQILFKLLYMRL